MHTLITVTFSLPVLHSCAFTPACTASTFWDIAETQIPRQWWRVSTCVSVGRVPHLVSGTSSQGVSLPSNYALGLTTHRSEVLKAISVAQLQQDNNTRQSLFAKPGLPEWFCNVR